MLAMAALLACFATLTSVGLRGLRAGFGALRPSTAAMYPMIGGGGGDFGILGDWVMRCRLERHCIDLAPVPSDHSRPRGAHLAASAAIRKAESTFVISVPSLPSQARGLLPAPR